MKRSFLDELEHRVTNLTDFNRSIFKGVYKKTLENILKQYSNAEAVPEAHFGEFRRCVGEKCKNWCKDIRKSIIQALMSVNESFINIFSSFEYFSVQEIGCHAQNEVCKAIQDIKFKRVSKIIEIGCRKISLFFTDHNKLVMDSELLLNEKAAKILLRTYRNKMEDYMKYAPVSNEKLQYFHDKLVNDLQQIINQAFDPLKPSLKEFLIESRALSTCMKTFFLNLKKQNVDKIEELQKATSKIITTLKNAYTTQIERVLSKTPIMSDSKYLEQQHEQILRNIIESLQVQIRDKIRPDEPLVTHEAVLKFYANQYWYAVKKTLPIEKEMHKNEQNTKDDKDACKPNSKNFQNRESGEFSRFVNSKNQVPKHQGGDTKIVLNPLIFHLQSTRITMAMNINGKMQILENEYKEKCTPAVVAINASKEFVYGSAAYQCDKAAHLYWNMSQFFSNKDQAYTGNYYLDNQKHKISVELFIAFLLIKLKGFVEKREGGLCVTTVLVIPYWLSSRQRIQLKDAAKVAGFKKAFLINEGSAAAYNCAFQHQTASNVLVFCENFDIVEAFVYFCDPSTQRLRMVAHKYFRFLNIQTNSQTSTATELATRVKDVCQEVVHDAKKLHPSMKIFEFLIICEDTGRYESCLNVAGSKIAKRAEFQSGKLVCNGACLLAEDLTDIENRISDRLQFEVYAEIKTTKKSYAMETPARKGALSGQVIHALDKDLVEAIYYQRVFVDKHLINAVKVKDIPVMKGGFDEKIESVIEINHDLTVLINNIWVTDSIKQTGFSYQSQYNTNLTNDARQELEMLLDYLVSEKEITNENPELTKAKEILLSKCDEISQKVEEGKFRIRSEVAKEMVLNTVKEAIELAEHAVVSIEELENQMEALLKLSQKYEVNC